MNLDIQSYYYNSSTAKPLLSREQLYPINSHKSPNDGYIF